MKLTITLLMTILAISSVDTKAADKYQIPTELVRDCALSADQQIKPFKEIEHDHPRLAGKFIHEDSIKMLREAEAECKAKPLSEQIALKEKHERDTRERLAKEKALLPERNNQAIPVDHGDLFKPGGIFNPIHIIVR